MEHNVIAHCTWFCRGVMSHICCSCILYPIYLPFLPPPSQGANCSFLTRGLKGWKALQIACKVHIQAAYLKFWQSFFDPEFSAAYKSVCPCFCILPVTPDNVKVFCGSVPHLEDSIVKSCSTLTHLSPSISHLRNKCSAMRELLARYTEGGARASLEKNLYLMPTNF